MFNSKNFSLILCLIMFLTSMGLGNFSYAQLQYATSFSTSSDLLGSGTDKDPYQITHADHLQEMQGSNSYFVLLKNIKVDSHNPISNFSGTFDGNGFTITINKFDSSFDNMGLFGSATGATIKNVDVKMPGDISCKENGYFGGVCAFETNCTIVNCSVQKSKINISGSNICVGGIVGSKGINSQGRIENCNNFATIKVNENTDKNASVVGGIAGICDSVSHCNNYGDITANANIIGGIAGSSGSVSYCYNIASILSVTYSSSCYVGGIVGRTSKKVECSTNDANIKVTPNTEVTTNTNVAYVGGIAGQSNGLFCLSNNGGVTLDIQGYEFYLGGISGKDSYTENTSQLISRGNVEFNNDAFNEEDNVNNINYKIGGVIGQSSSKSFSDVYCDALINLPLLQNEYSMKNEGNIFDNVGLLVGYSSVTSITFDGCYYMGSNSYKGTETVGLSTVFDDGFGVAGPVIGGEEQFVSSLEKNFYIKPFGNCADQVLDNDGLKVYFNSKNPVYDIDFIANKKTYPDIRDQTNFTMEEGGVSLEFYLDKIVYQKIEKNAYGNNSKNHISDIEYSDNVVYFPTTAGDSNALIYFWEVLSSGDNEYNLYNYTLDSQSYLLRGGKSIKSSSFYMWEYNFNHSSSSTMETERMSYNWKTCTWGKSKYDTVENMLSEDWAYIPFEYIGPLSLDKSGDKYYFNLNLIHLGPRRFFGSISASDYDDWYNNWYKEPDKYTFATLDLNLSNLKYFTSDKIELSEIKGVLETDFKHVDKKSYFVGNSFGSAFW